MPVLWVQIKHNSFLVLGLVGLLVAYFLKWPTFLFPKAATYNITGKWEITVNITSPMSRQGKFLADLNQDSTGRVTGTATDMDGKNQRQFTGQVTGNQFKSDEVHESGTSPITYEVTFVLKGTVSEEGNRISGKVTGQVIKPASSSLAGTFVAELTNGFPPSPTPTASPANAPTSTPIPTMARTPTPTTIRSETHPTSTPFPTFIELPQTAIPLPTILLTGLGLLFLILGRL